MIIGRMRLFGLGVKHHEEPCTCRAWIFYLAWFAFGFSTHTCKDHVEP